MLLPCCLLFNACNEPAYVTGIEKIISDGTTVTYQVNYSDGTSSNFVVENGKDGENGKDISIDEIFASCVEKGMYENTASGFAEFLKDYLVVEAPTTDFKASTNKALCSAVSVYSHFTLKNYGSYENAVATGAGVVYKVDQASDTAYVVTNYHVVYENSSIGAKHIAEKIYLYQYGADISIEEDTANSDARGVKPLYTFGGDKIECTYVGGSMNYDIAVLKVKLSDLLAVNPITRTVDIAEGYEVADTAFAVGNPEGSGLSVTKGIVNVDSETISMTGVDNFTRVKFRVLRIDCAINGGNSGGGLFNEKGELIGIVNAKIEDDSIDNMAYALPVDNITKVANNIIDNYKKENKAVGVKMVVLGLTTIGTNSKFEYNEINGTSKITDETLVDKVTEGGLASEKQLQAGDIITAVAINDTSNKITLTRSFQLTELLLNVREGDEIYIYYARGDVKDNLVHISATKESFETIA